MEGEVIPLSQVEDPVFSEEMLGKGVAIRPSGNRVVSPIDGTVSQMFDTGHAVSLISADGVELLIHVGLNTVSLKGEYYVIRAQNNDKIKTGDVLIEFDRLGIAAAGYDTVTPIVICNFAHYRRFDIQTGKVVKVGEEIIILEK